jgi:CheY-like chemotaxis protein
MVIEKRTETMSGILQQCGYHVIEEESLGQAVEDLTDFTTRERPDLILLDLKELSPEESWMVPLMRTGAHLPDLPIIGLAESDGAAIQRMTKATGCTMLFSRPNGIRQLTTMIDDLLSQAA